MAENLLRSSLAYKNIPQECGICYYPTWSTQDRPLREHEVNLEVFAELSASADEGCNGCKLLAYVWQHVIPDEDSRQGSSLSFNRLGGNLYLHIFKGRRVHNADVFTLTAACERDHPRCQASAPCTPARLIDIGLAYTATIRLIAFSDGSTTNPKYACLSHCWGHTQSKHMTYNENLDANMKGIPLAELPRTFRDAVDVTRALGLRYLWIDSLCIVQNSKSDWATHVEVMASIYENAHVTLAAGASSDDEGGFFAHTLYIRRSIDHPDAGWPAGEVLPLMQRGWCFQERLLARRYLLFGSKEILWECREEVACSCSMAEGPFNPRDTGIEASFRGSPATKTQLSSPDPDMDSPSFWRSLVTEYTARRLTYPQDKLPALAGLANVFEARSYLEGLWMPSLHQDFCWVSSGEEASLGRPRKGPSWSWVYSADVRIDWPRLYDINYCRLLGVVGLDSEDCERRITALKLSGIFLNVSLQMWKERAEFEKHYPLSRYCRVLEHGTTIKISPPGVLAKGRSATRLPLLEGAYDDIQHENEYDTASTTLEGPLTGHFNADFRFWSSEEELRSGITNVTFVAFGVENITGAYYEDNDLDEDCWVGGMLLKSLERTMKDRSELPTYERIGWLRYCTKKTKQEFVPAGVETQFILC
ncbi:HET-domain-containing protein [Setomelanomma holmii]|uniref:HET-domain-containing protein n=1 Tax=Setomelanomma holmii TaxID=210430 RepID=A0A9P4GZX4_9PLEO|nr:HET-domain-containing protein [Setomelanomma holmii]